MVKHIVINTYGSTGDLIPFSALGQALQARGHRVVIATDAINRTYIESAGIEFRTAHRGFLFGYESSYTRPLFSIHNSYRDLIAAVHSADLLITHQLALAGPLVAAKTNIPWVSVALSPFTLASNHRPFIFGTLPNSYQFNSKVYMLHLDHMNEMKQASLALTKQVQRLRSRLDLAPGKHVLFEDHHSPNLVLAAFSSAFASPLLHWPPQTRVTGFLFDNRLIDGSGLPPDLERFLDDGPPPIVFTLGSTAVLDNRSFSLQSILAANMLGRRAVLLGSTSSHTFPNNPNVISVQYAPHGEVFKRAAAIVHHGGIGTTAAAMRASCPMLVLPGYSWDQPDNAARAADLGVARMLVRDEYNAFSAASELAHLLHNPTYVVKSAEVGHVIEAEDGVGSACDEIEQFLGLPIRARTAHPEKTGIVSKGLPSRFPG